MPSRSMNDTLVRSSVSHSEAARIPSQDLRNSSTQGPITTPSSLKMGASVPFATGVIFSISTRPSQRPSAEQQASYRSRGGPTKRSETKTVGRRDDAVLSWGGHEGS